jgi:hypothetical protein
MNVGFGHVGYFHVVLCGNFQVGIYISFRVNYHGYACLLAADKVAALS